MTYSSQVSSNESFSVKDVPSPVVQSYSLASTYNFHEYSSDYRFQKTQNPVFRYDFRVGHYMPENVKVLNKQMFTSFNDVTTGIRRAP